MRIGIFVTLCFGWYSLASMSLAQETPTAVPTAVPVSATPTTSSSSISRSSAVTTRKLQPQSVTIALLDGMKLQGELTEVDQWTMKTSFGSTNLPLSTIAGMRMAQEGNSMTTVVLHNGDNLTGAVQLDQVVIQTEWGRAEINGNHIASILFTPGLKWSNETGLNGMRWKLVADEPARATPAAPGAPGQPARPGTAAAQPQQPARPGAPGFQQPGFQPGR
jgi:sRNA-binding regulator protein Hfq